jgi:hypothetical protein
VNRGFDDFLIHVNLPGGISMAGTEPSITSYQSELIDAIDITLVDATNIKQNYRVSLLNPDQSLTLSYYAYADEAISPPSMAVLVQKKDWRQVVVPPPPRASTAAADPFFWAFMGLLAGFLFQTLGYALGRVRRSDRGDC